MKAISEFKLKEIKWGDKGNESIALVISKLIKEGQNVKVASSGGRRV
jgi:hypothetical protein